MKSTIQKAGQVRAVAENVLVRGTVARRRQILSAAEACFSKKGFHGASMADIGKQAGVAPGHIYYYFSNKEELVAAVVESELEAFFELHDTALGELDTSNALVAICADAAVYHARRGNSVLWLEIFAEGGRNEKISDIVAAMDARVREHICAMLRTLNADGRGEVSETRIAVQYEVLSALVAGFALRTVSGGGMDEWLIRAGVADAVRRMFRFREDDSE